MKSNSIFCTSCDKFVEPKNVAGQAIYPHRTDLYAKQFLACPYCGNYVGTHADGRPLGTIPTPELRSWCKLVHDIIDAYWLPTKDRAKRRELYAAISHHIGKEYHTGELNTFAECKDVIEFYYKYIGL